MRQELTAELFSSYIISVLSDDDLESYCISESLDVADLKKLRHTVEAPNKNTWIDLKYEERLLVYSYAFIYATLKKKEHVYNRLVVLRTGLNISPFYDKVLSICLDKFLFEIEGIRPIDCLINTPENIIELVSEHIEAHQHEGFYSEKQALPFLPYESYEHPLDRAALQSLKGTPGLESMAKFIYQHGIDRLTKIQQRGSYYKVTKNNNERLWRILHDACEILDIKEIPLLYLSNSQIGTAYTTGFDQTIINISTSMEAFFTTDELYFVIGHELGHIKSGHILYHSMAGVFPVLAYAIPIPILNDIISESLKLSLSHWKRMSEFTCDRSGLLACQNIEAAVRVFAKISGYPLFQYRNIDVEEFLEQSSEFIEIDENKVDRTLKFLLNMYGDHPWAIERSKRLFNWYKEGHFKEIISGNYTKSQNTLRGKDDFQDTRHSSNISGELIQLDKYYKSGLIDESEYKARKNYLLTKL